MKTKKTKLGITLPLSVILISISLVIALGVAGIIIKEMIFSSIGRESNMAFYAADTGIECVLYWDKQRKFATSSSVTSDPPTSPVLCDNEDIRNWTTLRSQYSATTTFDLGFDNGSCVVVSVMKYSYDQGSTIRTKVESYGYNIGGTPLCSSSDPNRVERALRTTY